MRPLSLLVIVLAISLPSFALADPADDARQWFESEYAPLWVSLEELDAVRVHEAYSNNFHQLTYTGDVVPHDNSIGWWEEQFVTYGTTSWRGGRLNDIEAYLINPRIVMLEVEWEQSLADGSTAPGCFTYIAVGMGDSWKFTSVAVVSCADHQLRNGGAPLAE